MGHLGWGLSMPSNPRSHPIGSRPALFDRSDRARLEVSGPDRGKFLHNLTTNEVRRMPAGRGCETFVTSTQGKTLAFVLLHATEERILVRSDPGGLELALPHLRKYGIFDDVTIDDRSDSTFEYHLIGGEGLLQGPMPGEADNSHLVGEIGGRAVRIIRESPAGFPGLTILGDRADADAVRAAIRSVAGEGGLDEPGSGDFEVLRIEAGTPASGRDVTEKNLPQEFARDDRAISFVKGCYLGQETVARIDALGHVNQVLKGLMLEPGAAVPTVGAVLEDPDGKRSGVVTSSAFSHWRGRPVALAMVRNAQAAAGTILRLAGNDAEAPVVAIVADLPMPRQA